MRYRFVTVDVFTDTRFGGNPLAVFPEATGLNDEDMQRAAREFNLSETVFVLPPVDAAHAARLRIFTPRQEVAFAGHPLVGTACVLAGEGKLGMARPALHATLELGIGPLAVEVFMAEGKAVSAQFSIAKPLRFGAPPPPVEALAAMLSLLPEDLSQFPIPPQAAALGIPFLMIPVVSLAAMARARLDTALWEKTLAGYWAREVYLYCPETLDKTATWHTRMFAPGAGIEEDPATGSAAATLAAYIAGLPGFAAGRTHWVLEQGLEMGRPSRIEAVIEKQDDKRNDKQSAISDEKPGVSMQSHPVEVRIGGGAVAVSEGFMRFGG